MTNAFLISSEGARLLLQYGGYLLVIVVGFVLIALVKRKAKKELTPEWVKSRCEKAQAYANKIISAGERKGAFLLLGSTKLIKLNSLITDAVWSAYQVAEKKKDLAFEGIANTLDALATDLVQEAENGYVPVEDFERDVQAILDGLAKAIDKLNAIIHRERM